jgi:glycine/D-amino acid oxidase-like deaminating enzyme
MGKLSPEDTPRFSDPNDLESQVKEYVKVKSGMDVLEARQKELREKLFAQIDLLGEVDSDGNIQLVFDEPIDGVARIEKQRRVARKLDEEAAIALTQELGIYDDVFEMKPVLNEDALMAALYEDKLTEEQLDSIFPPKITWAFWTRKK